MAKHVATNDSVIENSIDNLVRLTSDLLMKSKKSKIIPPQIRKDIIEINHCAAMALLRIQSDDKLSQVLCVVCPELDGTILRSGMKCAVMSDKDGNWILGQVESDS